MVSLKIIMSCNDYQLFKKIVNWEIELTIENNLIEEKNYPD